MMAKKEAAFFAMEAAPSAESQPGYCQGKAQTLPNTEVLRCLDSCSTNFSLSCSFCPYHIHHDCRSRLMMDAARLLRTYGIRQAPIIDKKV